MAREKLRESFEHPYFGEIRTYTGGAVDAIEVVRLYFELVRKTKNRTRKVASERGLSVSTRKIRTSGWHDGTFVTLELRELYDKQDKRYSTSLCVESKDTYAQMESCKSFEWKFDNTLGGELKDFLNSALESSKLISLDEVVLQIVFGTDEIARLPVAS